MSSETKWTPGPWRVYDGIYWIGVAPQGADRGLGDPPIAHISRECYSTPAEERHANAHLIAAAPDLYAALEKAREHIAYDIKAEEERCPPDRSGEGSVHLHIIKKRLAEVEAALAKARGETAK